MNIKSNRLLAVLFPLIMLACIILLSIWLDYRDILKVFGIPAWETLFFDLEQIISAAKNSIGSTLGKPGSEIVSKAWSPFSVFSLKYIGILGWFLGVLFLAVVYSSLTNINKSSSIYIGLLLCSYATWFALERGQPDLIIFCLIGLALQLKNKKILSFGVLLYACILKFFPIGTIIIFWNQNAKKSILLSGAFISAFAFFFWLDRVTIFTIIEFQNEVFGGLTWKSFGSFGIFNLLNNTGLFLGQNLMLPATILGPLISIFIFLAIGIFRRTKLEYDGNNSQHIYFLAGAILYIASFVIGRNFDYKLIFLLFCIPFLWAKLSNDSIVKQSLISYILLTAIFICFWSGLLAGELLEGIRDRNIDNSLGQILRLYLNGFNLIKELLTWVIFAGLSYFTILLLPPWFGQTLNFSIFRTK